MVIVNLIVLVAGPYSASKAAAELAISSWIKFLWDCSIPESSSCYCFSSSRKRHWWWRFGRRPFNSDTIRALSSDQVVRLRNRFATRPWQHVLEPLGGYLLLAEKLSSDPIHFSQAYNFGPHIESNKTVEEMVDAMLKIWPGKWIDLSENDPREASKLHLQIDKSFNHLGWKPV